MENQNNKQQMPEFIQKVKELAESAPDGTNLIFMVNQDKVHNVLTCQGDLMEIRTMFAILLIKSGQDELIDILSGALEMVKMTRKKPSLSDLIDLARKARFDV